MHQIGNLDIILYILTLLSALIALWRGLIKEVLSVIGWVLAAVVVFYLMPVVTPLAKTYIASSMMASFVACLVILVVFYVLWLLLTFKLIKKLRKSKLNALDRGLGFIFGLLRAFLLVVLLNILMTKMLPEETKADFFAKSDYFEVAGRFAEPIESLLPEETLEMMTSKVKPDKEKQTDESAADLFEKLAQPKIKKVKSKAEQDGKDYDKEETQNLDRLIENAAE